MTVTVGVEEKPDLRRMQRDRRARLQQAMADQGEAPASAKAEAPIVAPDELATKPSDLASVSNS